MYVVRCADGSLYTGCTTDTDRRVKQHNGSAPGGAKYTASRRPVTLLAKVKADDRSAAQRAESRIKRMSRKDKEAWCLQHAQEAREEDC